MGAFIGAETVRVTFADGEWLDLKEELTQEDQDYITSAMLGASNTNGKPDLQIRAGRLALLERGVVAWSFTTPDGKGMPLTRENLSRLRARYRQPALTRLDELNSAALEFVRKN